MDNFKLILIIIIMSIGTFLLRFSFIYLHGKFKLPQWIENAMKYIPGAILSALIFPAIIIKEDLIWFSIENPRLVAGTIAMFIAWKTKDLLLTTAVGLGIFWLMVFL